MKIFLGTLCEPPLGGMTPGPDGPNVLLRSLAVLDMLALLSPPPQQEAGVWSVTRCRRRGTACGEPPNGAASARGRKRGQAPSSAKGGWAPKRLKLHGQPTFFGQNARISGGVFLKLGIKEMWGFVGQTAPTLSCSRLPRTKRCES
jgi:hypothetical protein